MSKPTSIMAMSPEAPCEKGYEVELLNPYNDAPTGMFVTVIGPEAPKVKDFHRAKLNKRFADDAKGRTEPTTVEALEAEAVEQALTVCTGWRGVVWADDEPPLEFTPENARRVLAVGFIRKQVLAAANDLGNFMPN